MPSTVFKPSGLPVFLPHGAGAGADCVATRLLAAEPWRAELGFPEGFAAGIAHRLDNATSGALWVADSLAELDAMREAFAQGRLTKCYRFLSRKGVPWAEHFCDREISHDRRHKARMVVRRGEETPHRGKWMPARTEFVQLGGPLWQAKMHTGVMHQIRVHAAFLGVALAGDKLYGGGEPLEGEAFCLHHVGLVDPVLGGTTPVPLPGWAQHAKR